MCRVVNSHFLFQMEIVRYIIAFSPEEFVDEYPQEARQ